MSSVLIVPTAFHWRILPTISLLAHRLDHPGDIKDLAAAGGRILAAAMGAMDEAGQRPLDGHGQVGDGPLGRMYRASPIRDLAS